jgi:putative redox protein
MPEGVPSEYPIEVVWEGGMRYRGGPPGGPTMLVDGEKGAAPSPVDALLVAIASCSAIDVVDYLEKRRTPPSSCSVSVSFSRAPNPPRRLTDLHLTFRVAADTTKEHADRAAELSFDKYCSVATSLAPDIRLGWTVELASHGGTGAPR